jgi:hypothetical protein
MLASCHVANLTFPASSLLLEHRRRRSWVLELATNAARSGNCVWINYRISPVYISRHTDNMAPTMRGTMLLGGLKMADFAMLIVISERENQFVHKFHHLPMQHHVLSRTLMAE